MTTRIFMLLLPMLVAGLFAGCEKPPAPTVPATGVLTFNGKPVAGASVNFVPESDKGHPAVAITDDDGEFTLSTFAKGDGAMVGTHKVIVIMSQASTKMVLAGMPSKSSIPMQYTTPQTTPFVVKVEKGKENHFKLDMTEKNQTEKKEK